MPSSDHHLHLVKSGPVCLMFLICQNDVLLGPTLHVCRGERGGGGEESDSEYSAGGQTKSGHSNLIMELVEGWALLQKIVVSQRYTKSKPEYIIIIKK